MFNALHGTMPLCVIEDYNLGLSILVIFIEQEKNKFNYYQSCDRDNLGSRHKITEPNQNKYCDSKVR